MWTRTEGATDTRNLFLMTSELIPFDNHAIILYCYGSSVISFVPQFRDALLSLGMLRHLVDDLLTHPVPREQSSNKMSSNIKD